MQWYIIQINTSDRNGMKDCEDWSIIRPVVRLFDSIFSALNSYFKENVWWTDVTTEGSINWGLLFVLYSLLSTGVTWYSFFLMSPWDFSPDVTALITIFTNRCRFQLPETKKRKKKNILRYIWYVSCHLLSVIIIFLLLLFFINLYFFVTFIFY